MDWVAVVVTCVLAVLFLGTGGLKLASAPPSLQMRDHLGVPAGSWRLIGFLEIAGAAGALAGLAVWQLGAAATGGLVLLSGGAIATHVKTGDGLDAALPAGVALLLAAASMALQITSA